MDKPATGESGAPAVGVSARVEVERKAEEALRRSETRFRNLVETTDDMVWEVNAEGVYTYVSPQVRTILGYEPEEIVGKSVLDLLPPEDVAHFEALYRATGAEHRPLRSLANRNLRKDGRIVYLETSAVPFYDANGRLAGYRGIDRDITERKRAEDALRDSEIRFRNLVEATPDWVWEVDTSGVYAYASPQVRDLLGYEPEEVLGKTPFDLMLPDEAQRLQAQVAETFADRRPIEALLNENRHKGGHVVVLETSGVPFFDAEGRLAGYRGIDRDVTARVHVEQERERLALEVQRRVAELDATINSIAVGLVVYNARGEVVRINQPAIDMLSLTAEDVHRPVVEGWERLHVQTPDGVAVPAQQNPVALALAGEVVEERTLVVHRADGRGVWLTGGAAPIRGPAGEVQGAILNFVDITPLHELQEQREDILRAVSHDLRNPLASIQGQAQLLERRLAKQGEAAAREREGVTAIINSARRMNIMIQDLVDAARSESGQLRLEREPLDLPAFVSHLLREQATALDTARVEVRAGPPLPRVSADPARLQRIVVNLLSNALKYSAPGTPVTISMVLRDGEVVTSVEDRGSGIQPQDLPHIFERYYRPRTSQGGVGLGLYITKQLVQAHGGRIWVESVPGEGSTFSFGLPVAV